MKNFSKYSTSKVITTVAGSVALLLAFQVQAYHFPWDQGHDTFKPSEPTEKSECPNEDNRCLTDKPVDLGAGDKLYSYTDFAIPALGPDLVLSRTYHSQDMQNGPFGLGWHSNLTSRAVAVSDGQNASVLISQGNGKRKRFVRNNDGSYSAAEGTYQTLTYNNDGTVHLAGKHGDSQAFDANGRLTQVSDRFGNTLSITYDSSGFIETVTGAGGRTLTFTKGVNGKVASVVDPLGRAFSYGYDLQGRLESIIDPVGNTVAYTYDANNNIASVTDAKGKTVIFVTYDNQDRVTRESFIDRGYTSFTYVSPTETLVRNPRGYNTIYKFNETGNPIEITDPLGRTVKSTWDENYNRTSFEDAAGNISQFEYDANGNLSKRTDALGNEVLLTYEANYNQVATITDPDGNVTQFEYDAQGNPTKITDALENDTTMAYQANGLLQSVTDALGNSSSYAYDAYGNLTTVTDPLGNQTSYTYDLVGNVATVTDAESRTTQFEYDDLDRLSKSTDALSGETAYSYDANGNLLTVTDAKGQTTTFEYDTKNRVTREINPLGQTITYTYDRNDNLTRQQTRRNDYIYYNYDYADQLTSKTMSGNNTYYTYDVLGNLTAVQDSDSALSFTYDELSRLTSVGTTGSYQPNVTLNYEYDARGNRTKLTAPNGDVLYDYDELGRLTSLTNPGSQTIALQYDALSRRTQMTMPNGVVTTYQYDAASQLLDLRHQLTGEANPLARFQYTYDDVGNITAKTQERPTLNVSPTIDYAYDDLDRLTSATHPLAGQTTETFTYDAVGNRLRRDGQSSDAQFNDWNQLLEDESYTYEYDNGGNRTKRTDKNSGEIHEYVYDGENRLTEFYKRPAANQARSNYAYYRYDAFGRRIEKNVDGVISRWVYDGTTIFIESNSVNDNYYTHLGFEPVFVSGTDSYIVHTDHLDTPQEITDSSGNNAWRGVFNSFGEAAQLNESGVAFNIRFPGQYSDYESGLYYNRYRDYDGTNARFIQNDPIGLRGGINTYGFSNNNPVIFSDPFGLKTYMCKKPLDAMGGDGTRSGPDIWGNPLYHQYICTKVGGVTVCGGQDRKSGAYGPGKPSNDVYIEKRCTEAEPDNTCIESCLQKKFSGSRPYYGLVGPGTNCQEWADDALSDCRGQCKKSWWDRLWE